MAAPRHISLAPAIARLRDGIADAEHAERLTTDGNLAEARLHADRAATHFLYAGRRAQAAVAQWQEHERELQAALADGDTP